MSATTAPENSSKDLLTAKDEKESFTVAASSYFALLSSLDVRLRRQIYALQEAEILPADGSSIESHTTATVLSNVPASGGAGPNMPLPKTNAGGKGRVTGGGLGSMDVGWLNSRNDHVGKAMEAELWVRISKI